MTMGKDLGLSKPSLRLDREDSKMTTNGGAEEAKTEHQKAEEYKLLPLPACPFYGWGLSQQYWWQGVRAQRAIALSVIRNLKKGE